MAQRTFYTAIFLFSLDGVYREHLPRPHGALRNSVYLAAQLRTRWMDRPLFIQSPPDKHLGRVRFSVDSVEQKSHLFVWITEMPLAFGGGVPPADPGQDDKGLASREWRQGEGRDVCEEDWKEGCVNQPWEGNMVCRAVLEEDAKSVRGPLSMKPWGHWWGSAVGQGSPTSRI